VTTGDSGPKRAGIGRPRVHGPGTGDLAGEIELADGRRIAVTVHCVDRFWERGAIGCVRFADALARLQLLAGRIGEVVDRPDWAGPRATAETCIALGPDLVLLVKGGVARTCLARGSVSDAARASRNQRRRRRLPDDGRRRDRRPPMEGSDAP
jgi:hypothetical protein